jgi:hypothetical protein
MPYIVGGIQVDDSDEHNEDNERHHVVPHVAFGKFTLAKTASRVSKQKAAADESASS